MAGMNERVRSAVKEVMQERGISQGKLAEQLGIARPGVTRLLSGTSGEVPRLWQEVLDALDLELVAVPKRPLDSIQIIEGLLHQLAKEGIVSNFELIANEAGFIRYMVFIPREKYSDEIVERVIDAGIALEDSLKSIVYFTPRIADS